MFLGRKFSLTLFVVSDGEPMKDRGTSESGLHIASDGGATPVTRKLGLATSVDSTPMYDLNIRYYLVSLAAFVPFVHSI